MNLSDKAMLARLSVSQWTGRKLDKGATSETAANHKADEDMVSTYKSLVAKKALAKITKLIGQARQEFYFYTLPWTDEGQRILTNTGYFKLSSEMRKYKREIEDAVNEFVTEYPTLKQQAKLQAKSGGLGTLFNEAEYPDENHIREKFAFEFSISPLPDAGDFRVKLSDSETQIVKQQIEQDVKGAQEKAMQDVWARMQKVVSHMADRLKAYTVLDKPVTKPSKRKDKNGHTIETTRTVYVEDSFKDSLVTNISDLLDVIPALNLEDDQNVIKFASYMRTLTKYSADQLKENEGVRNQVAQAADDILSKMASFI